MKVKKLLKFLTPSLILIASSITCGAFLSQSRDYILDRLSYDLADYNIPTEEFENGAILSFSKTEEKAKEDKNKTYTGLYNAFRQNDLMVDSYYEMVKGINYVSNDFNLSLNLFFQPTYSIHGETPNDYYLELANFDVVYKDELLGERGYLQYRNSVDSFIFITDVFADKLLEKYGIDSYETLIMDPDYYILNLTNANGNTMRLCINNIIITSEGNGRTFIEEHGDFGFVNIATAMANKIDTTFSVKFKNNPFGFKRALNMISTYGYDISNCSFNIYSYNEEFNAYIHNDKALETFISAYTRNDLIFSILYIVIFFLSELLIFIFDYRDDDDYILSASSFSLMFLIFLIFGIVVTFIYNYGYFSLSPLLIISFHYLLKRKEINEGYKKLFSKLKNKLKK